MLHAIRTTNDNVTQVGGNVLKGAIDNCVTVKTERSHGKFNVKNKGNKKQHKSASIWKP